MAGYGLLFGNQLTDVNGPDKNKAVGVMIIRYSSHHALISLVTNIYCTLYTVQYTVQYTYAQCIMSTKM